MLQNAERPTVPDSARTSGEARRSVSPGLFRLLVPGRDSSIGATIDALRGRTLLPHRITCGAAGAAHQYLTSNADLMTTRSRVR